MKDIFEDKRFSLIELLMISLAGALWTITAGGFGFALLMLVLVPWGIRLQQGRPPLRRTPLDLPLGLFFLTLLAATGLSYSGTEAWSKFWVMAGGVFLYFALVQQSRRDIWMVAAGAGPVAALLALYFVLTHNWNQWPAELAVIQWLGQVIMRLRPALPLPEAFHPNTFGGIIAMLLPFSLAFVLHARTHRR